jgi:hypothetical protein
MEFSGNDLTVKFGHHKLKEPTTLTGGSRRLARWVCDCGRETVKVVGNVVKGRTKSCGRCLEVSAEGMAVNRFGKLRMKFPFAVTSGSAKKVWWTCDCGRDAQIRVDGVLGGIKSCGHCTDMPISEISGRKFGKLCLANAKGLTYISPESHRRLLWKCDCSRTKEIQARYVMKGTIKTCGRCNELTVEELTTHKFGRLKMRDPATILANSNKKVWWVCDCGRELLASVCRATRGAVRSCGKCSVALRAKFERNKEIIQSLKTPISPNQIPEGCPKALEVITNVGKPFRALCPLCGNEYGPRWSAVRGGISLTCGCSVGQVSFGQQQLHVFIISLGFEAELEYKLGRLTYDIWVPERNLVVEYQGLKWHSQVKSRVRDVAKWRNALDHKVDFLVIYEDEWLQESEKTKDSVRRRLGKLPGRASASNGVLMLEDNCDLDQVRGMLTLNMTGLSDNRLNDGSAFAHLGFRHVGDMEPDFWWVRGSLRLLQDQVSEFDSTKYRRLWDLGKKRWELNDA